jgi:CheY-like chemotaxis protein
MATILIVEPDPMQREMLSSLLALGHHTVYNAANGDETIALVEHYKIDLVITELDVPGLDGFDLIGRLREFTPLIPVIALTACVSDVGDAAHRLGASAFFEKPLDADRLLIEVDRLLGLHQVRPIYNINVGGVLQMFSGQPDDCCLVILGESRKGKCYFQKGQLVHAEAPPLAGEDAVYEILRWQLHFFSPQPIRYEVFRTVHQSLMSLLMDAAVKNDENAVGGGTAP